VVKRIMLWTGIAFLLFFIAYRPDAASGVFQALGRTIADIGGGIGNFVREIIA
jgi:hypothetical protein